MVSRVNPRRPSSGSLIGYGAVEDDGARLPAPPTQARGVAKRDRIYVVALARFEAGGVAATTVGDVIAEAGVSWATFFRYFPRKGDVLIELAARHYRDAVRPVAEAGLADRRVATRTVIARSFETLLTPGASSAAIHNAALLEVFAHPSRFAALVSDDDPQPVIGLVRAVLTEGERRGELRRGTEPGAAALTLVAGGLFPAVQAASLGADPAAALAVALEILWSGLGS